ncbi:hypothetical protein [Kineosporia babensis]|uniref:Uncharacterized protein n=1 Tax=Kineosporia babensis TaxID=499548 RepID=A0A9X1N9N4_9ACTN|nr:hypothetical protein [Kineosporia babensis]MCD5310942.1 hypothetical protein [Kineosporia babensis]
MSGDFRFGLEIEALVQSGPNHSRPEEPTYARQWAVLTPDGECSINGDQHWTQDGRALKATHWDTDGSLVYPEGSRVVHRDIHISYEVWVDQESGLPVGIPFVGMTVTQEVAASLPAHTVIESDEQLFAKTPEGEWFRAGGIVTYPSRAVCGSGAKVVSLPDQPTEDGQRDLVVEEIVPRADPDRCGAKHPTNPTAVPCRLRKGHRFAAHWSTTGCSGSEMRWHGEAASSTPSPEVREVPLSELRDGDAVTVTFVARSEHDAVRGGLWLSEFEMGAGIPSMFLVQQGVAASREIKPLPTTPGTVGTARIDGGQVRRIALNDDRGWYDVRTFEMIPAAYLSDFVELLAGDV